MPAECLIGGYRVYDRYWFVKLLFPITPMSKICIEHKLALELDNGLTLIEVS